jgi:heme-degrading monooxygenase HmoA
VITLVAHFHVRDYDAWKVVFDEQEGLRRSHGGLEHCVYRDVHDGNRVVVHNDFPSEDAATAFRDDPALKQAMIRAGVEGEAGFDVIQQAEHKIYADTAVA